MDMHTWLASIVKLETYGTWENYVKILYEIYENDFIKNQPLYNSIKVRPVGQNLENNMQITFWHIIQKAIDPDKPSEKDREPDLKRCERIPWPKNIIDNHITSRLKTWIEKNRGQSRVSILCEGKSHDYLVILIDKVKRVYLLTAFPIFDNITRMKYKKRWERYK
jgi:hypothetical protein